MPTAPTHSLTRSVKGDVTEWKVPRIHSEKMWFELPDLAGGRSHESPVPQPPNLRRGDTESPVLGHFYDDHPGLTELLAQSGTSICCCGAGGWAR